MKILAIPEGIAIWDSLRNEKIMNGRPIYIDASELIEIIRWLECHRYGFIKDELSKIE